MMEERNMTRVCMGSIGGLNGTNLLVLNIRFLSRIKALSQKMVWHLAPTEHLLRNYARFKAYTQLDPWLNKDFVLPAARLIYAK